MGASPSIILTRKLTRHGLLRITPGIVESDLVYVKPDPVYVEPDPVYVEPDPVYVGPLGSLYMVFRREVGSIVGNRKP